MPPLTAPALKAAAFLVLCLEVRLGMQAVGIGVPAQCFGVSALWGMPLPLAGEQWLAGGVCHSPFVTQR